MNTQELQDLIQEAKKLAAEMNHIFKSMTQAQDPRVLCDYVEYEDYYCRFLTVQDKIEQLLKPHPPVADTVNDMREIKLLHVSIGINIAIGIWSLLTTVICVKFDRRHDRLTSEIKALEDSITARNQTISQLEYDKLVLQEDTATLGMHMRAFYNAVQPAK